MRRFHSYGPVDCEDHFCAARKELIRHCTGQLVGNPKKGGHYFTIWAPRQAGKTWLMRQVVKRINAEHGDIFQIGMLSVQGVVMKDEDHEDKFLEEVPLLLDEGFSFKNLPVPENWNSFRLLFDRDSSLFDKPLIIFIDEFDSLPRHVIDRLVTVFRDMYLKKEKYLLHGLALIGVRAVLGVESDRGFPFNIQRSLHVPNLTWEEAEDLYQQYQEESGQTVEPDVVKNVFEITRGQPGLVCWFGELLTEKYNPGAGKPVDMKVWKTVYRKACYTEWNNTVLNLVKKARKEYLPYVLEMFSRPDMHFRLDTEWCSYLYLNGIIDADTHTEPSGEMAEVCRFSSPFIQERIYNALTFDMIGDRMPILALEPWMNWQMFLKTRN